MVQFNQKSAEEELRISMVDMFRKLDEVPISRIAITEKWDLFNSFYTGLDAGYTIGVKNSGVDEGFSNTLYRIQKIMEELYISMEDKWFKIKSTLEQSS